MKMGQSATEAIELVRRGRGPSVDGFPALGNPSLQRRSRSPMLPDFVI